VQVNLVVKEVEETSWAAMEGQGDGADGLVAKSRVVLGGSFVYRAGAGHLRRHRAHDAAKTELDAVVQEAFAAPASNLIFHEMLQESGDAVLRSVTEVVYGNPTRVISKKALKDVASTRRVVFWQKRTVLITFAIGSWAVALLFLIAIVGRRISSSRVETRQFDLPCDGYYGNGNLSTSSVNSSITELSGLQDFFHKPIFKRSSSDEQSPETSARSMVHESSLEYSSNDDYVHSVLKGEIIIDQKVTLMTSKKNNWKCKCDIVRK